MKRARASVLFAIFALSPATGLGTLLTAATYGMKSIDQGSNEDSLATGRT